jgi:hypothetical protein
MGFYNFCYSLALFFFVVGYWQKHQAGFTWRTSLIFAVLCLLLYYCHPISFTAALLAVGVLCLVKLRTELDQGLKRQQPLGWFCTEQLNWLLPTFIAFLPGVLLAVRFAGTRAGTASWGHDVLTWLRALPGLDVLVTFGRVEAAFASVTFWVFAGLGIYCLLARPGRSLPPFRNGWLAVALVFLILYAIAPPVLGTGMYINERLSLFPFFALLLWLGGGCYSPRLKHLILTYAALTSMVLAASHLRTYQKINEYLQEYASVTPYIEANRTVLPLTFAPSGPKEGGHGPSGKVGSFLHAAGHIAVHTDCIDLGNYEANTDYFPLIFRPAANPYRTIGTDPSRSDGGMEEVPPRVDFLHYARKSGHPVDYVLIEGLSDELRDHPATRSILDQLHEGYEWIYTSSPHGLVQLYRRREGVRGR